MNCLFMVFACFFLSLSIYFSVLASFLNEKSALVFTLFVHRSTTHTF